MRGHSICGVLVHVRPEHLDALSRTLGQWPGVELHARDEQGHLVVTVEDHPERGAADTMGEIAKTPGVLSAALVYEQTDYDEPLQELAS